MTVIKVYKYKNPELRFRTLLTEGSAKVLVHRDASDLQRELYGPGAWERYGLGALSSLMSLVGIALILVGDLGDIGGLRYQVLADLRPVAMNLFLIGLLVATVGILALGVATIAARKLPWWCGAALIAGSPPIALFLGPLMGVPWVLVGYAVFRAGSRQTERPSQVR
jgi:MFS family permease